jgi:hypothetical protein
MIFLHFPFRFQYNFEILENEQRAIEISRDRLNHLLANAFFRRPLWTFSRATDRSPLTPNGF